MSQLLGMDIYELRSKSLEDALRIRSKVLAIFEHAELETD